MPPTSSLIHSLEQASSTIQGVSLRVESLRSALASTKHDLARDQEELGRLALVLDNHAAATEAGQPVEGNQLRLISGALAAIAQRLTKSSDALRDDVIAGI